MKKSIVEGHRKALQIAFNLDAGSLSARRKGAFFIGGGKKVQFFVGFRSESFVPSPCTLSCSVWD